MSSPVLAPYRCLVAEVHRRLYRLTRCVSWMLERGQREAAEQLLAMLLTELQFHHGLEERRLHPIVERLSPGRSSVLARLEADHRRLEEEIGRLVNLLSLGSDSALVQKRTERLQDSLLEHFSLEHQAFAPLESLVAMNADAVAPGT